MPLQEQGSTAFPSLGSWEKVRRLLIDQLPGRESGGEPDDLVQLPSIFEIVLVTDKKFGRGVLLTWS